MIKTQLLIAAGVSIIHLCFLFYLFNLWRTSGGGEPRAGGEYDSIKQTARANIERRQAAQGRIFDEYQQYSEMVLTLQEMEKAAIDEERTAAGELDKLNSLNQFGSVIAERRIKAAAGVLYRARLKRISIKKKLIAARRGKDAAIEKLQAGK